MITGGPEDETIRVDTDGAGNAVVTDSAGLTSTDCQTLNPTRVSCSLLGGAMYRVDGQGGDDDIAITPALSYNTTTLAGGDGNDTLAAGNGATLQGGTGSDTLLGDGTTIVDYSDHTTPVTVDLGHPDTPQGAAGENDHLSGISSVIGTPAGDVLTAGDAAATLDGGRGDDVLTGGPGDDAIDGGAGSDSIDGGAGDDELSPQSGYTDDFSGDAKGAHNVVRGGAGDDVLGAGSGQDRLIGGPGQDFLGVYLGIHSHTDGVVEKGDHVVVTDGEPDAVLCAPKHPPGSLALDAADLVLGCGHVRRDGARRAGFAAPPDRYPNATELGSLEVGCPDAMPHACRVRVALVAGAAPAQPLDTLTIKPGRTKPEDTFGLAPADDLHVVLHTRTAGGRPVTVERAVKDLAYGAPYADG